MVKTPVKYGFIGAIIGLVGCQTIPKSIDVNLPVAVHDVFDTCQNGEGSLHAEVSKDGENRGAADLDWVIKGKGTWITEVYNPLGQTVLRLAYQEGASAFQLSGPLRHELPEITIQKDRFVAVDGHFTGLKSEEIACLLKFKMPRDWLDNVKRVDSTEEYLTLDIRDQSRQIKMDFTGINRQDPFQVCAQISWSQFLGFGKAGYTICHAGVIGARQMKIEGVGHYSLKVDEKGG